MRNKYHKEEAWLRVLKQVPKIYKMGEEHKRTVNCEDWVLRLNDNERYPRLHIQIIRSKVRRKGMPKGMVKVDAHVDERQHVSTPIHDKIDWLYQILKGSQR